MQILFDGRVRVDYHQCYVESGDERVEDYDVAFAGQANALLGAGNPGSLILSVSTSVGDVGLRVVLRDDEPPTPDQDWEEVVEASFRPADRRMSVRDPLDGPSCEFELPVRDYRARLCARGFEESWDLVVDPDEPLVDHYELTFWPAPPAPDAVLRLTSQHTVAIHRARDPELARQDLEAAWDGDVPDERLVRAEWFTRRDRDLAERMLVAGPYVQRQLAYWAATTACREARIDGIDFVAAGLRALVRDEPLGSPFDDPGWMYQRLQDHPENPGPSAEGEPDRGGTALFTVLMSVWPDPLDSAINAVSSLEQLVPDGVLERARRSLAELVVRHGSEDRPDSRTPEPPAPDWIEVGPDQGWFTDDQRLAVDDPAAQYLDPRSASDQIAELAQDHPEIVAAAEALSPEQQREAAFGIARHCCTVSGLNELYWVNDAFMAFGQNSAPEPWSNGTEGVWLMSNPRVGRRTTLHDGTPVAVWPFALQAVRYAVGDDSQESLLLAVAAGLRVAGDTRREEFLGAVRWQLGLTNG